MNLTDAFSLYTDSLLNLGYDDGYLRNVRSYVTGVIAFTGWRYFEDVSSSSFLLWRDRARQSPKTLNNYMNGWKSFLNWCVSRGFLEK